jgi:hypothetical protein
LFFSNKSDAANFDTGNYSMATGDTLAIWGPLAGLPPTSGFASLDVRNGHVVLDFDAAADESALFGAILPAHYGGGDLTVELHWTSTSATSGNVRWLAAAEKTTGTDIDADGFGSASAATAAAPTSAGALIKSTLTVSAANAGNPAAGDALRLKVTRDADHAADTMAGDAELWAVHLLEA